MKSIIAQGSLLNSSAIPSGKDGGIDGEGVDESCFLQSFLHSLKIPGDLEFLQIDEGNTSTVAAITMVRVDLGTGFVYFEPIRGGEHDGSHLYRQMISRYEHYITRHTMLMPLPNETKSSGMK